MRKTSRLSALFGILFVAFTSQSGAQEQRIYSRDLLIEDLRQLAQIFETAHPDPYTHGGGKIPFHRKLQAAIRSIPNEGMTAREFHKHLLPFVAALGDGHTSLLPPDMAGPREPGLPVGFDIVEKCLYVASVSEKNLEQALGARLVSLEGVPFAELMNRQRLLQGSDNEYGNLVALCRGLRMRAILEMLLPEWKDSTSIHLVLRLKSGDEREFALATPRKIAGASLTPSSKIKLPPVERTDFGYQFMNEKKTTVLLRIDGMFGFRENFQYFNAAGVNWAKARAVTVYKRFNQKAAPNSINDIIAGIPSATEVFRSLVIDMRNAGSKTLLIDLRKNSGGNSLMGNILTYFLYGKKRLQSLDKGYSIKKYSDLYFSQYTADNLEKINADQPFSLMKEDYDFSGEVSYHNKDDRTANQDRIFEGYLKMIPTFMEEVKSGKYDGYYLPEKVIVICSAWTYSSGYDLMATLYKLGATLVGVPSSQAGNCFGDVLMFKLKNTGISGQVSFKLMLAFPDDPERGRLLQPDFPLTYSKLASCDFDPNADILLAIDLAKR